MKIGNKEFDLKNEYYVMGILNITPDSFSDGGKYNDLSMAKERVATMLKEGADIIDIGGESTRPGHEEVSLEEEIARIVPVIEMIKADFNTVISVDTGKSGVAKVALEAGADMVNDVWGFRRDEGMAVLLAEKEVPVCLMHNQIGTDYKDLLKDVKDGLEMSLSIALKAGVKKENIIIDPGIGFGKTTEQNLYLLKHLDEISPDYPILLGTSRKSVIGNTLKLPVNDRVEGTLATTVLGMTKGASIFRVHDIKENHRAISMTRAIVNS